MAKAKRKTLPKDFETLLKDGDVEALKRVFDSCDFDARDGVFKQTALAFDDCPDELARWLIAQGADISARDAYGETALHSHAGRWNGRIELLVELGADVNDSAEGRGTPLHRAAATGNLSAARVLLDHGADANAVNHSGATPLLFALQRCSNATITQMAPMAELLLRAMAGRTEEPSTFLSRLFGGAAEETSPITPEMRAQVQRIGTDFEFHRARYNPEHVDATSEALERLYALFGVAPVPRRALHDGKSPIAAKSVRWQDRHQELWELLVPSSGASATVQGEVIRISGRIGNELDGNGGVNWDADYRKMADAFLRHIGSATPLPASTLQEAIELVSEIKARRGKPARLCELAVDWVMLNPTPIKLAAPDYRR